MRSRRIDCQGRGRLHPVECRRRDVCGRGQCGSADGNVVRFGNARSPDAFGGCGITNDASTGLFVAVSIVGNIHRDGLAFGLRDSDRDGDVVAHGGRCEGGQRQKV